MNVQTGLVRIGPEGVTNMVNWDGLDDDLDPETAHEFPFEREVDRYNEPDQERDPELSSGEHIERCCGPDPADEPDFEELERLGMRKSCATCSGELGRPVLMQTLQATAAEIYRDDTRDKIDIRTWAVCDRCGGIVWVA